MSDLISRSALIEEQPTIRLTVKKRIVYDMGDKEVYCPQCNIKLYDSFGKKMTGEIKEFLIWQTLNFALNVVWNLSKAGGENDGK